MVRVLAMAMCGLSLPAHGETVEVGLAAGAGVRRCFACERPRPTHTVQRLHLAARDERRITDRWSGELGVVVGVGLRNERSMSWRVGGGLGVLHCLHRADVGVRTQFGVGGVGGQNVLFGTAQAFVVSGGKSVQLAPFVQISGVTATSRLLANLPYPDHVEVSGGLSVTVDLRHKIASETLTPPTPHDKHR